MEDLILFVSCLFSFASGLISLLFFLKFKKSFFFHVFLIMIAFFMICTNSYYVSVYKIIDSRIFLCVFGAFLSFFFSYGITGFALDYIQISRFSVIRKIILVYSLLSFAFSVLLIFIPGIEHPSSLINICGIWIPTIFAVLIGIIFFRRGDKGVFRREKWIITVLAALNLIFAFFVKNVPYIFIISVSILIFHIFYKYSFSSPMSKNEKILKPDFIKDFSITKREQEIILALLEGKSNKELADTLFVSEKTIESHLASIYRKTGVKNRLELFARLKN